ncbi:hypothetical protein AB838_02165 [Rhodobacteraceae bacterium (ex Bugula neritina AB1)]|nr:hypothetical protein AB833_28615 [Chromatiales bacterium (ex Bugula neritina AB1)]OED50436.1 hypothetical protein AB838_02165 [Rhodobacteraceae bacterium (ex Bugula neritina AB1)]
MQFAAACLLNTLIGLVLWRFVSRIPKAISLQADLAFFVVVNVLAFVSAVTEYSGLLSGFYFGIFYYVLPFCVSVLSGIIYLLFALEAKNADSNQVNGYRLPLYLGFFGLSFFSFIYIFSTATVFFAAFVQFTCLCILISHTGFGRAFDLSGWRFAPRAFVVILLGLPISYTLVKHAGVFGATAELVGNLVSAVVNREPSGRTRLSKTAGDDESSLQSITTIYNDYWFLSEDERLAVSDDQLFRSVDGGSSWEKIKDLSYYGDAIHFDSAGKRGWVGERYSGMEITEDGGETWRELTVESAYRQATGKRYKETLLRDRSEMHLDPETGYGSFTARCRFFYSRDFAKTWNSAVVNLASGKKDCLLDTPFAMNDTRTLALAGGLFFNKLYRYDKTGEYWQPLCDYDGELATNHCATLETLTDLEKQFVAPLHWPEDYIYGGTRAAPSVENQITRVGQAHIGNMRYKPQQTGNISWFVGRGFLALSADEGRHWKVEVYSPEITKVLPVSDKVSFAFDKKSRLWLSENAGMSWQQYFSANEEASIASETSADGKFIWILFPRKLVRIGSKT